MDSSLMEGSMQVLMCYGYAMPRLFAMYAMIPVLTRQALPGMLRTGVVVGIATLLVPALMDPVAASHLSAAGVLLVIMKEVVLGLALGFVMGVPLWALEAMGSFIDSQRGASIAQIIDPLTGHDSSPLGELFSQAAVVYLLVSGGMLLLLSVTYRSYELWPIFDWWPSFNELAPQILLGQLDRLMHLTLLLGSPVIVAMLLSELGLALVSRFAPQLQVFFLAMPIKSGLAMFVLGVYATALFDLGGGSIMDLHGALDTVGSMLKKQVGR